MEKKLEEAKNIIDEFKVGKLYTWKKRREQFKDISS